ncbi:sigma-70 family RNA polymerase sigma factor [Alteromonas sediminis]|uniref:RNA polymerase sigma factor n=1 Tax=Alteromonas sediminis TaxID=2259342 RepID=A0A3N5ZBJ5_9ALTE|nr:sigma-70 family RNA polymerase sigma factor [Alteromonas sediminis]RPJ66978.1 sigma-70 family RNA polymerase sigma factor [Alteromonas sediminis]
MNDQTLIMRILVNDDQHAFTTLVRSYQQPIRQFLCRLTQGNRTLADDLAQHVFIAAYDKLATFRAEANFSTWLHSIAYRAFLNEMRKAHYQQEAELTDQTLSQPTYTNAENEILVEQLMTKLSFSERTCMTLAFSAGMSHQEIATITDFPLGTVKSHINRGKQKLTGWLNESQTGSTK